MMIRTLFMAALMLMSGAAQAGAGPDAEAMRLSTLNHDMTAAYILQGDTAPFERSAVDNFVLVAAIGMLEPKQQVIDTVGGLDVANLDISTDRVEIDGDSGMVVATLTIAGTVMGHQLPPSIRQLSFDVKRGGEWRLMGRAMTPIRTPPGAP